MNYMIYAKLKTEKRYGAMNLQNGTMGVGLVYATLISDIDRARVYRDEIGCKCPAFDFQVRVAGTSRVIT